MILALPQVFYELFKVHSGTYLFILSHICHFMSNFSPDLRQLFQNAAEQNTFYPVVYFGIRSLAADRGNFVPVELCIYGMRGFIHAGYAYSVF